MERKKSKILTHYEEILDENFALQDNLEKVINQVFSCVDYIKNSPEEIKQKDCSLILKHQLEVLKKLTEINLELESVLEENPLKILNITEKQYENDTKKSQEECKLETSEVSNLVVSPKLLNSLESNVNSVASSSTGIYKNQSQEECKLETSEVSKLVVNPKLLNSTDSNVNSVASSSTCIYTKKPQEECKLEVLDESNLVMSQKSLDTTEMDFNSVACSSAFISELISNPRVETQPFSGEDIQTLRETLRKFSEKFGFNAECISSIKDYYEKPSTSSVKEMFDRSSFTQIHDFSIDNVNTSSTNFETNSASTFEFPEKDTNITINSERDVCENGLKVYLPIESASNASSCPQVDAIESSINVCPPIEIKTEVCCENESGSSTDTELSNTLNVEITSSEEPSTANDSVSKTSDLTSDSVGNNRTMTEEGKSGQKKIVYTALEKLNNTKIFDRREEALKQLMSTVDVPNIKLKPAATKCSTVIKNDFETNNNKLRKKKNRKKKCEVKNDNVFYELKSKPAPTAGTLCAFSHVESPNEFYIHVVDEECALIDMITEQINEYYMDTTSDYTSKETACSMIGTYCFAFISKYNNGWYRAKVLDWYLDSKSDEVLLQLVDYGDKRRTSYVNLRKMTNELSDIPMLAIRCHLPLMYPPRSTFLNRLTEWPSETIDAIVELSGLFQAETAETKLFTVVYAQPEGDSVAIDLYNPKEVTEEYTVGQILLNLGLAVQILENYDENNLELEEYLQDVDSLERADNINEAVVGYDPRDEARICRFTKRDGTCYKGKHCKLEHIPLPEDGFTTDTVPVFKEAMYSLQLPAHGEEVNILITGYKDTCNFFAQIIRTPLQDQKYFIDQSVYILLKDMNHSKTVASYETFKISPAIGEIVIAKHWSKKWLRAVVRERVLLDGDESEEFQVFTVDFGDYLKLPLSEIRKILPHFLELPFQAVECYVHNYKAKRNCDLQRAKKFFYQNLYFQNFRATAIRSTSLPLKVGVQTFNGIDVGKTLAENGFAEERRYDHNPMDGCALELY